MSWAFYTTKITVLEGWKENIYFFFFEDSKTRKWLATNGQSYGGKRFCEYFNRGRVYSVNLTSTKGENYDPELLVSGRLSRLSSDIAAGQLMFVLFFAPKVNSAAEDICNNNKFRTRIYPFARSLISSNSLTAFFVPYICVFVYARIRHFTIHLIVISIALWYDVYICTGHPAAGCCICL